MPERDPSKNTDKSHNSVTEFPERKVTEIVEPLPEWERPRKDGPGGE